MLCFDSLKRKIKNSCRTLIILVQDKNTSLKLPVRKSPSKLKSIPVGVSPLQLVNLHRNRRYFIIKLHTWFCLPYWDVLIWATGHCNWEAVSRNRYGVEKTVDTHKILIVYCSYICAYYLPLFLYIIWCHLTQILSTTGYT
jgi:hypothetical protein